MLKIKKKKYRNNFLSNKNFIIKKLSLKNSSDCGKRWINIH